jgi:hypothetical protein
MLKFSSLAFMAITLALFLRVSVVNSVNVPNQPYRPFSSNPPKKESYAERGKIWKEEGELVSRLLLLAKAGKFETLLQSLKVAPSSTSSSVFSKVIQPCWGIPLNQEIELKDEVFDIMWRRDLKPTIHSITPMLLLYGKSRDIQDKAKSYEMFEMMIAKGIKRDKEW